MRDRARPPLFRGRLLAGVLAEAGDLVCQPRGKPRGVAAKQPVERQAKFVAKPLSRDKREQARAPLVLIEGAPLNSGAIGELGLAQPDRLTGYQEARPYCGRASLRRNRA